MCLCFIWWMYLEPQETWILWCFLNQPKPFIMHPCSPWLLPNWFTTVQGGTLTTASQQSPHGRAPLWTCCDRSKIAWCWHIITSFNQKYHQLSVDALHGYWVWWWNCVRHVFTLLFLDGKNRQSGGLFQGVLAANIHVSELGHNWFR